MLLALLLARVRVRVGVRVRVRVGVRVRAGVRARVSVRLRLRARVRVRIRFRVGTLREMIAREISLMPATTTWEIHGRCGGDRGEIEARSRWCAPRAPA